MIDLHSIQKDYVEIVFYPTAPWELSCCAISAVTTCFVIILCIISGFYKTHTGRIVIWINFSDFTYSIPKIVNAIVHGKGDGYCLGLQFVAGYGLVSSIIANALFGHALLYMLKNQTLAVPERTMKYYVFFCVILPLAEPIASYFTKIAVYSPELGTCVHRVYNGRPDYSFIFQRLVPFGLICTSSMIFYLRVVYIIRSVYTEAKKRDLLGFLAYPGIVMICWFPNLILDILLSLHYEINNVAMILMVMNGQLLGFWDSIAYGLSKNVRSYLRGVCCKEKNTIEFEAKSSEEEIFSSSSTYRIRNAESELDYVVMQEASTNP